jgi:hypothetical protein
MEGVVGSYRLPWFVALLTRVLDVMLYLGTSRLMRIFNLPRKRREYALKELVHQGNAI